MENVNIMRVTHFGDAIETRDDGVHPHADMLRYDLAFCNPKMPSMVVFPVFKTPDGTTQRDITYRRWQSFGMRVSFASAIPKDISEWVTYVHDKDYSLKPVTYAAYTADPNRKKWKPVGYRSN